MPATMGDLTTALLRNKTVEQLRQSADLRPDVLAAAAQLSRRATPTALEQEAVSQLAQAGLDEDMIVRAYSDYMAHSAAFATEVEIKALSMALPSISIEIYR